jgi:hypothetical protein
MGLVLTLPHIALACVIRVRPLWCASIFGIGFTQEGFGIQALGLHWSVKLEYRLFRLGLIVGVLKNVLEVLNSR